MADNFIIGLIASLKKGASKKQIQSDAKNLGDIKVPLVGTLNKTRTKAQLKQDLSSMNGTVNLTGKFNSKGVTASVRQATAQAQKQANAAPVQMSFSVKKEKLINDIKLLAQQNSRLFKNTDMTAKYNSLLDNAKLASTESQVSNLRMQLNKFNVELKETKYSGMTMIDVLKNGLSKVLSLFGNHGIIKQFTAQLRNAWKEAQELDASITSLSKIPDELVDRSLFPAYIDKSISKAKELCTDVNDLLYAVTEFKKLGNTLENSEILAEYAIRLQNVGDTDIDTAISSIKTAMATFDEISGYTDNEYENKVEAYIDLINNLSNKFSIDAESLSNAVRISAGTLVEANTSIEEAASIITAANKYYDDPSYLANTIKIGALRLRASKTSDEAKELAELGENIDDLAESTSNLREEMLALTGVDIMVDDKNFKSYYQQLLDISKVYQSLDETTQANVLEKMFGKNRSAAGENILKAMADSVEVYNEALQSAGSSEEEFSRWTESAEAATKKFGVAMTETYSNIISGDTVKGLANVGTAVLDFANKLGLIEKGFKGILIIGAMKGITTLTVAFKSSAVQLSNYGKALDAVKKVNTYAQGTQKYAEAMDTLKSSCANLTDTQLKQVLANRNLSNSQLIEILGLKNLKQEQRKTRLAQLGLTQATNAQTKANVKAAASTFSFSSMVAGLGTKFRSFVANNKVTLIIMAISAAISFVTTQISAHSQKLEETRQKAAELAEAYKQQQSSLDSQIKKYKELKESLDSGNLSVDEARSIKEQLLEIQNSLIDSYGNEVSNIDLVNGKYREQLGLLSELSKEKAEEYVTENYAAFEDAKKVLGKQRSYNIGSMFTYDLYDGMSDAQQQLYDFIKSYSELFDIRSLYDTSKLYSNGYVPTLFIKGNADSIDSTLRQFEKELQVFMNTNGLEIDLGNIKTGISNALTDIKTDDTLTKAKSIYDEYMKAEIVKSDTLRPLYKQSIQAVADYNKALSSGEGIEEAKANLDSVQQSVKSVTGTLEGSQDIFDDIYGGINKNAEAAYNLNQAFKNDETVKEYAEQLHGLTDIDLKAINFNNENIENGEEAFTGLMRVLGLTEDQAQSLIDKLVELGYVQGKVQDNPLNNENYISSFEDAWANSFTSEKDEVKKLGDSLLNLAEKGRLTIETFKQTDSTDYFKNLGISAEEAVAKISKLVDESSQLSSMSNQFSKISDALRTKRDDGFVSADTLSGFDAEVRGLDSWDRFQEVLGSTTSSYDECREAANALATEWINNSDFLAQLTEQNKEYYTTQLKAMGIENYEEIIAYAQELNSVKEALSQASFDLATATSEEIQALIADGEYTELAEQQIWALILAKQAAQGADLDTADDCQRLLGLAKNAGVTGKAIELLTELMSIYNNLAHGIYGTNADVLNEITTRAESIKQNIFNLLSDNSSEMVELKPHIKLSPKTASSAGKSAGESFTDALDKELAALDKKMEAGYIDFDDYIQVRLGLIEDYYKQGKLSADEYYSYLEKHYDTQLSYMDKVVNSVTRRIDTELDALKQQKEDVENIYNVQIDSLEKEKTLLEEANRERQRQKDLQKSIYDMERARNQRTQLVYSEDKGMHYVADDQAVRDAQEDVYNARYDIQIAEIEKSVSNLEDARDKETSAIDDMISNLEAYKDAWSDVTSAYATEQENMIAAQILGADWETDILNSRIDVLNDFKRQYISIQQEMADAAWKFANEQANADFQAYASGTNNAKRGLNLVGEDGAETYFDNHGHVAIVTKPTLIPMEGGEVVKNERDTKKLLDPDNLAPVDTIGLADIDGKEAEYTIKVNVETNGEIPNVKDASLANAETITLSDGTVLAPYNPDIDTSEFGKFYRAWNTTYGNIEKNVDESNRTLSQHLIVEHNQQMNEGLNRFINNSSSVVNNNRNMQQPVNNTFNITMPNVTNSTSAERLMNDLQSLGRKKFQVDWNK